MGGKPRQENPNFDYDFSCDAEEDACGSGDYDDHLLCRKAFWEHQAYEPSERIEGEEGVPMMYSEDERVGRHSLSIFPTTTTTTTTVEHHRTDSPTYHILKVLMHDTVPGKCDMTLTSTTNDSSISVTSLRKLA